jgi:hypothetical protein
MAQYPYFERNLKRFPYHYGIEKDTKEKAFINKLKLGEVFLLRAYTNWNIFQEQFKAEGVIIDRFNFTIKRLKRYYDNAAAIVVQKGDEIYSMPDLSEGQMFDPKSLY